MRLTRAGVGAATLVMAITPATGAAETPRCLGRAATITGGSGDVIRGTPGDDVITAYGDEYDVLAGRGNDLVCADSAYDVVQGGPGDDHLRGRVSGGLYGGRGDDQIDGTGRSKGGSGDDRVTGGGVWGGPDQIVPKHGDDEVHGGGGSDSVHYFFWPEPIEIDPPGGRREPAATSSRGSRRPTAVTATTSCAATTVPTSCSGTPVTTASRVSGATTRSTRGPGSTSSTAGTATTSATTRRRRSRARRLSRCRAARC